MSVDLSKITNSSGVADLKGNVERSQFAF